MKRWADELVATTGDSLTLTGTLTASDVVVTDDLIVTDRLDVDGTLDADGPMDLSGADSIDMPPNTLLEKQWVSAQITESSIVGGSTTESIAVVSFPATIKPLSAYILCDEAATSGNGATTTLSLALGVAGLTAGYLAAGANVIGATGRQQNAAGILLGSYRTGDTLLLTLTTNGGGNTGHINNLAARVVINYTEIEPE